MLDRRRGVHAAVVVTIIVSVLRRCAGGGDHKGRGKAAEDEPVSHYIHSKTWDGWKGEAADYTNTRVSAPPRIAPGGPRVGRSCDSDVTTARFAQIPSLFDRRDRTRQANFIFGKAAFTRNRTSRLRFGRDRCHCEAGGEP